MKNYLGKDVLIAQTGTKLKTVGELVIGTDGKITSRLRRNDIGDDAKTQRIISREIAKYEPLLKQPVGEALLQLCSNDPQTGERLVRNSECSLANFVTDAFKAVLNCDVVMVNGGSIRNEIKTGVVTYNDLLEAFPFGNMCAVIEASGQQILDALEMGASHYPEEFGGFYQVAGMEYTINKSVPSTVILDEKGNFSRVGGLYRVSDVRIGGQPLDINKKYTVGGITWYALYYMDSHALKGTAVQRAFYRAAQRYAAAIQRDMLDILRGAGFETLPPFAELKQQAKGYAPLNVTVADGWLIAAEAVAWARLGYRKILCVQPFACLPGHILGKGQYAALQRKLPDARLVSVDYDASTGEGTVQSRIRMLLDEQLDDVRCHDG